MQDRDRPGYQQRPDPRRGGAFGQQRVLEHFELFLVQENQTTGHAIRDAKIA